MPKSLCLFLCILLPGAAIARAKSLPDACGSDKVKFKVTTDDHSKPPAPPEPGKARIVFLGQENQMIGPFMHATVRFGMDGHWVGANEGNSYFVVDVAPGEHHVCATWKPPMHEQRVELAPVTAEAGKVYYVSGAVTVESQYVIDFGLTQLNQDQGSYRMQKSQLATWKEK